MSKAISGWAAKGAALAAFAFAAAGYFIGAIECWLGCLLTFGIAMALDREQRNAARHEAILETRDILRDLSGRKS